MPCRYELNRSDSSSRENERKRPTNYPKYRQTASPYVSYNAPLDYHPSQMPCRYELNRSDSSSRENGRKRPTNYFRTTHLPTRSSLQFFRESSTTIWRDTTSRPSAIISHADVRAGRTRLERRRGDLSRDKRRNLILWLGSSALDHVYNREWSVPCPYP